MAFLGQEEQLREFQDRFRYLYAAVLIALGLLLLRLIDLQILRGDKMRHYSEENRIKRVKIPAPRGMILDQNRRLLIDNRPAFDLEIIPQYLHEFKQTKQVISLLSKLVKIPEEEIFEILEKNKSLPSFLPVKIKTDLDINEVAIIESWKIDMPGVQITEEIKRTNLFGDIASHLLGYIGEVNSSELSTLNKDRINYKLGDSIGKFGLEKQMETLLRGMDGEKLVEVDALGRTKREKNKGRVLTTLLNKPSVPGKNLILTIDQDIQLVAAKAFGEKSGALVAIDPRSGAILGMLSRPSFDPTHFFRGIPTNLWNELLANENKPLRDKTIQDHYPPGSVFKVVTAIAGLQEGVIDEHTDFYCSGSLRLGNRLYHCWQKQGHGHMNVISAITQSCDVFFYRVAQKLGVDKIAQWARALGLGQKTGIPLARETSGLIPTEEWKLNRYHQPWQPGETLPIGIGQGYIATTIIQLANLYASIANGGNLYRPYLVKQIESNEGQILQDFKPEIISRTQTSSKITEIIKQGLWGVTNTPRGTAFAQQLAGMDFVGKTGTAQVIRLSADKVYSRCENMRYQDRNHALFAGFAPANDPKIAVAVILEHDCHGATGAAPIARAVIKTYLEKYYPELYGERALASRLKKKGPQ